MTDQHRAPMPAQFNLNEYVKVKLTDRGRDVLAMQQFTPELAYAQRTDADGYTRFQLWELMNIFGKHVYNGCSIPFEFNRILLAPFLLAPSDSTMTDQHNDSPDAFKTLCSYARNYIEERGDKEGVDELKQVITSLSQRLTITLNPIDANGHEPAKL